MSKHLLLGIDGGATKTQWALYAKEGESLRPLDEGTAGPGSMALLTKDTLLQLLASLPRNATHVGVYLAGCATERDRDTLRALAATTWPGAAIRAGSDRECGFAAAFGKGDGIAVIAGTGSAVTGRRGGREEHAGGWGHLLGDTGGGYDLAIRALRRVLFEYDTGHRVTGLAKDVLQTLGLKSLRELSAWAQTARKHDLARLTPILFQHTDEAEALEILSDGAAKLSVLTSAVATRLGMEAPVVRLMGGVFLRQPLYARLFAEHLYRTHPGAESAVCDTPASLGAALLAMDAPPASAGVVSAFYEPALREAATEQSNPRSAKLDRMTARELVDLFVREEREVENALAGAAGPLAEAVERIAGALRSGGRLFYAGAGTSGRLGILDASEMPPTFGTPPDLVQALIAGGPAAIQQSIEGAEDDAGAGRDAVDARAIGPGDVLCGITASARTPYVRGALEAARKRGAQTILLTCNPARDQQLLTADIEIDLSTGPELITGSTRLKAGTATKVALNILSSCAMIQFGRVAGNSMSHLRPTNDKLRDRAIRIVSSQLRMEESAARRRLECANWNIAEALASSTENRSDESNNTTR